MDSAAAPVLTAFDHKLSIIFDLAMGGGYPDGVCGCTTPTSSTSSGGTMSVAYVAAYQAEASASPVRHPRSGQGGSAVSRARRAARVRARR